MKVYNKYHGNAPEGSVYIGRPSVFGNPYTIGKDGTREEVLSLYSDYLERRLGDIEFMGILRELSKAPGLLCFCSPKKCHGDLLIKAMKRWRYLPVDVGDETQWESRGEFRFDSPMTVERIESHPTFGDFAFVTGGTTGIKLEELLLWEY